MYGVDIVNLAKLLNSELQPLTIDARCIYAESLMEKVAELVNLNDALQEDILLDDLSIMYESIFPPQEVFLVPILLDYVKDVRAHMRRHFWDPRCKVKVIKQRINKRFHRVIFVMDLEATTYAVYTDAVPTTTIEHLEDIVDENPSQELLERYETRCDFIPPIPEPRK